MLKIEDLHVYYGAIHAIKGVSFEVGEGEIVALIGANGAGKTSTLRAISGLEKITDGEILLDGQSLAGIPAPKRVSMGISQVPEGRRIFPDMSVFENLEMGAYLRNDKEEIKRDM